MGEVYVKVTLTNAVDEGLFRRGLLAADQVRRYEVDAVVHTGAACTVLPQAIAERLGLAIRSRRFARYADSHYAELDVTEPLVVDIDGHDTTDEALVVGDEVLIGQTVLEKLNLLVDCDGRRLIPNPRRPFTRV
jgi:clan AA aspartic protease